MLWLYLEEKGEEIIGGRWGSDAEERENLSRNSFVEYDRDSMSSSLKCHDDEAGSVTSREFGRESQMSKIDENLNETDETFDPTILANGECNKHDEVKPLKYSWFIEQQEGDISEIRQAMSREEAFNIKENISDLRENISNVRENVSDTREEFELQEV